MADGKTSEERSVGAESLKAFAHPLRMAMYEELTRVGSATASQLARTLKESSGQTSYHLRQLERHGFVEDDPAHSAGRERWWRPVGLRMTADALFRDPATEGAALAVARQAVAERASTLAAWLKGLGPERPDSIGQLSSSTLAITDTESEQLVAELDELINRWSRLAKGRDTPGGARRFRVHLDVLPLAQPPES